MMVEGEGIAQPTRPEVPVSLYVDYPERLSRWRLFVKALLAFPYALYVTIYGVAAFFATFASLWVIKYWPSSGSLGCCWAR